MSRTVVNEPSGTVSPLRLRTRIFSTSLGSSAVAALGLRGHAEGAAEQVEVVDVGRAEIDLQRGEHVGHVDAEQLRLGAVDVEIELRRRGLEQREHLLQRPASARRGPSSRRPRPAAPAGRGRRGPRPSCGSRRHCRCRAPAAAATTKTSASWIDATVAGTAAPWMAAADLLGVAGALLERVEHEEDGAGIRRIGEGRAGEADDVHGAARRPAPASAISIALAVDLVGAGERGARRQLRRR